MWNVGHVLQIKWYDHVSNQEVISGTGLSSIGDNHLLPSSGTCGSAASAIDIAVTLLEMSSNVLMLVTPRYAIRRAAEDHLDVRNRPGCIRLVMAPQPPSANGSRMGPCSRMHAFPRGERDRRYGPAPPKCSDDDDDDDD